MFRVMEWGHNLDLCYIFKLFASKSSMDGIEGPVKNVTLRKVKSGQLVVQLSETVRKFVP